MFRRMLGPVQDNGIWGTRHNNEIYQNFIRQHCYQHLLRYRNCGVRNGRVYVDFLTPICKVKCLVGKPRKRCEDAVPNDALNRLVIKVRREWSQLNENGDES